LFDGVRPYQRIPFQYSLFKVDGKIIEHYSFLAKEQEDPRPKLLMNLKKVIDQKGAIITIIRILKERFLREMTEAFPEYAKWADQICGRLVDILKPFQNFICYYPEQHGDTSMDSILPAVTGKGYQGLAIASGDAASGAYLSVTYGEATEEDRRQVYIDLEKYCSLDTEGMIWIVDKLRRV